MVATRNAWAESMTWDEALENTLRVYREALDN